jgi:hypothetical protein
MNTPQPPAVPQASSIVSASQKANYLNQNTPFANLNYQQNPDGTYSVNQSYSPQVQQGINNSLGAFNAQSPQNVNNLITNTEQLQNQYMAPWFNQQQSNLNSQLQSEGFAPSDAAYQQAQRDLQNNQTNWVGGNVAQFAPIAMQAYQQPLQAASQLAGLGEGSYVQTPQTDVTGAYNTQVQGNEYNYGQQVAQNSAMLGGLFGIPTAIAGGWASKGFPGLSMPNVAGTWPGTPSGTY